MGTPHPVVVGAAETFAQQMVNRAQRLLPEDLRAASAFGSWRITTGCTDPLSATVSLDYLPYGTNEWRRAECLLAREAPDAEWQMGVCCLLEESGESHDVYARISDGSDGPYMGVYALLIGNSNPALAMAVYDLSWGLVNDTKVIDRAREVDGPRRPAEQGVFVFALYYNEMRLFVNSGKQSLVISFREGPLRATRLTYLVDGEAVFVIDIPPSGGQFANFGGAIPEAAAVAAAAAMLQQAAND